MNNHRFSIEEFRCFADKKKPSVSFVHINAQSARNKEEELTLLLGITPPFDAIMLTETWYRSEQEVLKLDGYTSYF